MLRAKHVFIRYPLALAMAVVVTASLLWIMQALIQMDEMELDEEPVTGTLVFLPTIEDIPPEVKREPPVKVRPPDPPPMLRPALVTEPGKTGVEWIGPGKQEIEHKPHLEFGLHDGNQLALVKVAPDYPSKARMRGIEGYVVVAFTIAASGEVVDPRVVEAAPSNVFNRSALKAVSKFKYRPKVVNGEAIPVHGVRHRIVYELQET